MPATIKDLARACGVSISTVSYVLNNGPRTVHPSTRERVLAAARQMGYNPNAVARGLSRKRMNTLGIVMDYWATPSVNMYFVNVLHGILDVCNRHHQNTMLIMDDAEHPGFRSLDSLTDGRCDGFLVMVVQKREFFARLKARGIPFVLVNEVDPDPEIASVDVDNVQASADVVRYLLSLRHRRIAILTGHAVASSSSQRLAGYRQAFAEAGIAVDESLLLAGDYNVDSGYELTLRLADRPDHERPTAICCGDDNMAVGALHALRERHLRVPEDMSVIGFNDIPNAAWTNPPLTTVRQPLSRIGARATEILLQLIESGPPCGQKEVLPTELILRESSAPPRSL